jgi:hypothetical protein
MRNLRLLGVWIATFGLTACLNSTTLVKLKTDGSGTIEQTTLMNPAALKGLGGGQQQKQQANGPMMNRADLERAAERMGKGVKLVSTEPATGAPGWEGTKAIFSFDDVNQIQINTEPARSGGDAVTSGSPSANDPVKFKFTRNGPTSTLNIDFVDKPGAGKKPTTEPAQEMPDFTNPMMLGMLKTMFQGFKINVDLEVVGTIVKTNAAYVTGPRMTLLEVDMGALLADEAKLKALQGKIGPDASFSELKPYLKDIKGIKIDGPSIRVEFK